MKKFFSLASLAVGVIASTSGLFSKPAHAAPAAVTSNVEIEVNVPDIVFLQTYDRITFYLGVDDLTTATAAQLKDDTTAGSVAANSNSVTPNLPAQPTTTTGKTTKTYTGVLLYRTWGLGASTGQIEHGITAVSNALTLTGGAGPTSTITMTSPVVTNPLTKSDAPGIDGNAIEVPVDFTFDLTNVKRSGLHTGGSVTVSAQGI